MRLQALKKDKLPMSFFKYGVISFAEGNQSLEDFVIFWRRVDKF
jgi:hypothetical protein